MRSDTLTSWASAKMAHKPRKWETHRIKVLQNHSNILFFFNLFGKAEHNLVEPSSLAEHRDCIAKV